MFPRSSDPGPAAFDRYSFPGPQVLIQVRSPWGPCFSCSSLKLGLPITVNAPTAGGGDLMFPRQGSSRVEVISPSERLKVRHGHVVTLVLEGRHDQRG